MFVHICLRLTSSKRMLVLTSKMLSGFKRFCVIHSLLTSSFHQVGSSHQRCSIKKGVLRNFAKFTGKHLCQSLFFNEVAGQAIFFTEHLWTAASTKSTKMSQKNLRNDRTFSQDKKTSKYFREKKV